MLAHIFSLGSEMYDDSRIAFGGALAAADLLTTDEAGVMQRAKLSTKIFAVVGRKEAPEVSEELRSLWRLRERCPNHTGPEKKRFTTLVQDVLDEVDLGQLAMLTCHPGFLVPTHPPHSHTTRERCIVRQCSSSEVFTTSAHHFVVHSR